MAANLVTITTERAHQIIAMNAAGEKPLQLEAEGKQQPSKPVDLAEQEDLTRFDKVKRKQSRREKKRQTDAQPAARDKQPRRDNHAPGGSRRESRAPRGNRQGKQQPGNPGGNGGPNNKA